jgi:outer membrane lipoprotein carrier protein
VFAVPAVAMSGAHASEALADETPPPVPAAATGSGPSAEAIADKVQAFYDSAKTYSAGFQQRYTIYAYNRTKDSSGKVVFSKPGQMRWTYTNNGNVVVSDGKNLKIYEQENRQMYVQTVEKAQYAAALSFLWGEGSLKKSFELSKLDSVQLGFSGGHVLLGTPRSPTPAFQKILFYVDSKTFQVRRVLLIDAQKNRNRFDFETARVNELVEASLFQFTPPAGTNVVKP